MTIDFIDQRELDILVLQAWRYCSTRHYTQAFTDRLNGFVRRNVDNISTWVLEQIYDDICREYRSFDRAKDNLYEYDAHSPYYLEYFRVWLVGVLENRKRAERPENYNTSS